MPSKNPRVATKMIKELEKEAQLPSAESLEASNSELEPQRQGKWNPEEDELLRLAVEEVGDKRWKEISYRIPGRSSIQCLHRWTKILRPGLVKGPWTDEENNKLKTWVEMYGAKKWSRCSDFIQGRSGKQCREHWVNKLDPELKKGNWTTEEDEKIFQLYQVHGSSWAKIEKHLPGRTENAIKNRFYSTIRKLATDQRKKEKKQKKSTANQKKAKKELYKEDFLSLDEENMFQDQGEESQIEDNVQDHQLDYNIFSAADFHRVHPVTELNGYAKRVKKDIYEAIPQSEYHPAQMRSEDSEFEDYLLKVDVPSLRQYRNSSCQNNKQINSPYDHLKGLEGIQSSIFEFGKSYLNDSNQGFVQFTNIDEQTTENASTNSSAQHSSIIPSEKARATCKPCAPEFSNIQVREAQNKLSESFIWDQKPSAPQEYLPCEAVLPNVTKPAEIPTSIPAQPQTLKTADKMISDNTSAIKKTLVAGEDLSSIYKMIAGVMGDKSQSSEQKLAYLFTQMKSLESLLKDTKTDLLTLQSQFKEKNTHQQEQQEQQQQQQDINNMVNYSYNDNLHNSSFELPQNESALEYHNPHWANDPFGMLDS